MATKIKKPAGKVAITHELAVKLEDVTGIPASFWRARELQYRERLGKLQGAGAPGW